ncbi:MAG TPA: hypothetical protein VFA37_02030 [Gaiellaceae bacterium]|nr:hypothetical protein [Gaiellaceae bacterium]
MKAAAATLAVLAVAAIALTGAVPTASSGKVVPNPGTWKVKIVRGGSGSGTGGSFTVNSASFGVSTNHKQVVRFGFSYSYSGPIKPPAGNCSGNGVSTAAKSSAIKSGRFYTASPTSWSGAGSATYNGVFTSARKAHGTAVFSVFITGTGCQFTGMSNTGTATWTATR